MHYSQKGSYYASRVVNPEKDSFFFILLVRCSMIVIIMCPLMSLIATIIIKHPAHDFFAVWVSTVIKNFPMALGWQVFAAGPVVRCIFRNIFVREDIKAVKTAGVAAHLEAE